MTVLRPLGDVLTLRRDAVTVDPTATYRNVGVLNRGRGLFEKPELSGSQTAYASLFRVGSGQLIFSKLFAWEGAISVVDQAFDGAFVSSEFPTFAIDPVSAEPAYLKHVTAWEGFVAELGGLTSGLGQRRQRVNVDQFLSVLVPMPHVDEQRRIAAHLDAVASFVASDTSEGRKPKFIRTIQAALTNEMVDAGPLVPLADIADVNPTPCAVGPDDVVGFVPMAAVSDRLGQIGPVETRTKAELTSGYKQFMSGDVIFARITPCMQNGKSAVYRSEQIPIAYGSTEFHVIRAHDPQVTKWLHRVLRSQWFLDQAVRAFTGTAGQQRVPASFLRNAMVPIPRHIAGANMKVAILERLQVEGLLVLERAESLRTSLLPAARNEVFSAMR